jgi:hypothetical protein
MAKIFATVFGVLVLIAALGAVAAGIVVLLKVDDGNFVTSGDALLEGESNALVSETQEFTAHSWDGPFGFGDPESVKLRLKGSADDGRSVFLGIGREADVMTWLEGASFDEVDSVEFDPFAVDIDPVRGDRPVGRPTEQSFWLTSASGEGPQELTWEVQTGDFRIVVMNADASAPATYVGTFAVSIPNASSYAWLAIISGALFAVLAVAGIALSLVYPRRPKAVADPGAPGGEAEAAGAAVDDERPDSAGAGPSP